MTQSPHVQHQQLAAIVRSSHDAIVSKTLDGVIVTWNDAATLLYGYAAEEIVGRDAEILYPVDRRQEEIAMLRRISRGEHLDQVVTDRIRADGSTVTVALSASPVIDSHGQIVGAATISRDIGRLRRVEAKWRAMLEAAPDAIVAVDQSGRITFVNAQAERLFGYDKNDLLGQLLEILVPEQARDIHKRHRMRYLGEPNPRPMGAGIEPSALRRDGTRFPAEISLSAIEIDEGSLVAAAIRDVSERVRRQKQLERANRAKDVFLAGMSHELRTPLNAIIGFTGTLLMGMPGPLNEEQTRQLRLVETSGQHLLSLVNDLLDLSRIEAGKVDISMERIDYPSVVTEVVQSMRPFAEQRGITLTAHLPEQECYGIADRRALGQILINLVHNAIKFTAEGEVRIELRRDSAQDEWTFQVSDTGPGIAADEQARIFGAYERSATARQHGDEGMGLGLYISHKLAELMGYSIQVSSVPGEGSTFYVTPTE